jgi:hypothetical protein
MFIVFHLLTPLSVISTVRSKDHNDSTLSEELGADD